MIRVVYKSFTMKFITISSFIFMSFLSGIQADEEGSKEKIIIHVPYKIHNHVHTHTNYKVIKVPEKHIYHHQEQPKHNDDIKENDQLQFQKPISTETKTQRHEKILESDFQPIIYNKFNEDSTKQMHHIYQQQLENRNQYKFNIQEPLIQEHFIYTSTGKPMVSYQFKSIKPDYQFGEDASYFHSLSTTAPIMSHYKTKMMHPAYEVEEENQEQIIPQSTTSFETFGQEDDISNADALSFEIFGKKNEDSGETALTYTKNLFKGSPYSIQSRKFGQSSKRFIATPTSTLATSTVKSTLQKLKPATNFKNTEESMGNNGEYEHIGYLVVGEDSQKFVKIQNNKQ